MNTGHLSRNWTLPSIAPLTNVFCGKKWKRLMEVAISQRRSFLISQFALIFSAAKHLMCTKDGLWCSLFCT